jgi:glutathione-regulated potassium-efflux system ancillary protein KefC
MSDGWEITLSDPAWIAIAFLAGLLARTLGLPPLVGYLVAGLGLHELGAQSGPVLQQMADIGVILLLFTIGLKLSIRELIRPEVFVVGVAEVLLASAGFSAVVWLLAYVRFGPFAGLDPRGVLILSLALSFSSTVFAVKVLEDRGAGTSHHGRLAIGVLVLQDIVAVAVLAATAQDWPSAWALLLLLLLPARTMLRALLNRCGHGELLLLFGVGTALIASSLFEATGIKGGVGALALGMLLAGGGKADELSKSLLGLKDLFLVAFFLSVGMTVLPDSSGLLVAAALVLVLPLKSALYLALFSRRFVRARTAWQASLDLTNYSEFGLVVVVAAATAGWVSKDWVAILAVVIAASFALSAPVAERGDLLYAKWRSGLKVLERKRRLPGDEDLHVHDVDIVVFGLGRMGSRAYDAMQADCPGRVMGIDIDASVVATSIAQGRKAIVGDATDPEFWSRADGLIERLEWVLLTMSAHEANVAAVSRLRSRGFTGRIAATSTYPDDAQELRDLGAEFTFDVFAEAGTGFASDLADRLLNGSDPTGVPDGGKAGAKGADG